MYWLILVSGLYFGPIMFLLFFKQIKPFSDYIKDLKSILQTSWILGLTVLIVSTFFGFFLNIATDNGTGNFVLHFVGGGVNVALIWEYIKKNLTFKIPFIMEVFVLYFVVSGFGAANELLEYLLDTFTRLKFSPDRTDTWKDILANTLGCYTGFLLVFGFKKIFEVFKK